MTKEKKVDDVDLDDGLDFQDFEMGFEELGDDREPKSKPAKSFAKGVKKGLTDTDQIKAVFRKNLPPEYADAYGTIDDVVSGTQSFAKEIVEETKPIINDLAYAADKFLPKNFVKAKERLQSIQEWAKKDSEKREGMSKEEMQNASLNIELGRIFEQQQKVDLIKEKIDKKDKALDRGLSIAQHQDILSVLIKNANANISSHSYLTTINSAWQRKSLETQYRTLFTIKDLLDEQKVNNSKIVASLITITKNTALPEYAKTQKDEAFLQEARSRFSSKLIDASHNFFSKGIKKFKDDVKGTISDLSSMTGMVALMGDMHAMEQEFDPKTLEDTIAGGAGSYLGKYILGKGGQKLFDLVKTKPEIVQKILKGSNVLKSIMDNKEGMFKDFISNKADEGSDLFRYLNDIFEFEKQNNTITGYDHKKMFEPAVINNRFVHSVTDVIPGYLARILQQTMITNGAKGKEAELIKFDFIKNKFSSTSSIVQDIQDTISVEALSKNSDYYFKESLGRIENIVDLDDEQRTKTAAALLEVGSSGAAMMPANMTNEDFWINYVDNYELAKKLASAMQEIYGTNSNEDYLKGNIDVNKHRNSLILQENIRRLTSLKKDFSPQAQLYSDFGLLDEAHAAGLMKDGRINYDLIDKNIAQVNGSLKGKASEEVDYTKKYTDSISSRGNLDNNAIDGIATAVKRRITKKDKDGREILGWTDKNEPIIGYENDDKSKPILGTSDVNKKTNIQEPKGSVLSKLRNIAIKTWNYKPQYEDGGETTNMGPMAQDLKKNFGEEVAPGGTTIDLVNANGVVMKAIQELDDKVKNFFTKEEDPKSSFVPQDQLSALRGIYYNTSVIAQHQLSLLNINSESLKALASGLGVAIDKINFSAFAQHAQNGYNEASKFIKENSASSLLGKLGDLITDQGEKGIERGKNTLSYGYTKGKGIAGNIFKTIGDFRDKIKLKALETFDVYVEGEKEPRMINLKIRTNRYLDFSDELKPIKTRAQIRAIKGVIVEVDEDGNIVDTVLTKDELEKVYFVNVYKNIAEKAFDAATGFLGKNIKRSFSLLAKGLKGSWNISKKVNATLLNVIDQPIDIYVKDKLDNPVMLAKKMREGVYIDFHSGETITRPSMIKGAVYDSDKKEIVLSNDEFRTGIVDIYNKPISKHAVLNLAGKALAIGAGATSWAFGKISKMPGLLGKAARSGGALLKNIFGNIPGISFGFFGQESVDILKDIRNILQYQSGLGGDVKSLSKIAGKTIKPKEDNKSKNVLAKPLESVGNLTTFTPKAASNENINAPRAANDDREPSSNGDPTTLFKLAGAVGSIGGSIINKIRGKSPEPETQETKKEDNNQEQKENLFTRLSKKITNLTKEAKETNAAKKAVEIGKDGKQYVNGLRKGSWQERLANMTNKNKEVIKDKNEVRKFAIKNIFSMLADMVGSVKKKLSDWVGSKKDPVELAEDIAGGNGDKKETRKERKEREKLEKRERASKGKSRWFNKPSGLIATATRVGAGAYAANAAVDSVSNVMDGNYGDAAIDAGKAAVTGTYAAGGFSALAGGASKLAKGVFSKGALKALGAAGVAYGAYSAYDNFSKGNYGSGALDAALTIGGGALLLGKGGALAGGAAALLFNPVTWMVGAGALGLYLAYKGYKRLTRKNFSVTEKMRMLEYGLRGADDDLMRTIHEFELYMQSVSTTTKDNWLLDEKKFKIEEAFSIFNIDKTNAQKVDDFVFWLTYRFKPIFGKWKVLVKNILTSDKIEDIEKAKGEQLLELYKNFRLTPEAYVVGRSPFVNVKINSDPSVISNFRDQWLFSLKDDAAKKKDNKTGQAIASTGQAIVDGRKEGKTTDDVLDKINKNKTTINVQQKPLGENTNELSTKIIVSSSIDASTLNMFSSNSLSALQAVRMKTYGLLDLRLNDLIAIRNLEAAVQQYVSIDSSGKAVFNYDPLKILEKVAGYFAVNPGDEYSQNWLTWFKNRFLPTFLNYHTCLFSITKKASVKENLLLAEKLKASEALTVAKLVMGTFSVWSVKEYCFRNQSANTNVSVCNSNINFLENKIKQEVATQEQSTSKEKETKVEAFTAKLNNTLGPSEPAKTQQGVSSGALKTTSTPSSVKPVVNTEEVEDPSIANKASAPAASSTISSGAVSNLSSASGDLLSGSGAMQYLNLNSNARLEGVHPSIKRLFLGMVEEYGQITGKKVTLNQGFRTYAEQAKLHSANPSKAARPGSSLHEFGLALDVSTADLEQLEKLGLLRKYGFTRPLGSETWHLEAAGIHDPVVRNKAKKDHNYATQFIESGIGRGGGGLGSRGKGGQVTRDDEYAKRIFNAASKEIKTDETKASAAPSPVGDLAVASKAANNDLGTTKLSNAAMPESEVKEGKLPTTGSSIVQGIAASKDTQASVGKFEKPNYEITSGVKGTVGGYSSLPESTGRGWSGNGLLIKEAAKLVGVDPAVSAAIAAKESSLNPQAIGKVSSAGNNPAQGLYQFMPGTWSDMMKKYAKKYGIPANATPLDARANALLGMEYIKTNAAAIGSDPASTYLGHLLGTAGAKTFKALADDDIPAKHFSSAASNNPYIFYHNGDRSKPRNKKEFIESINGSLQKQLTEFKIPLSINGQVTAKQEVKAAANDSAIPTTATAIEPKTQNTQAVYQNNNSIAQPSASSQTSLKTTTNSQPVASASLKNTAPVAKTNTDYERLAKLTDDHIKVNLRTNELLEQIKDVLVQGFAAANVKTDPKVESPTNKGNQKSPVELPNSYVQRKRIA